MVSLSSFTTAEFMRFFIDKSGKDVAQKAQQFPDYVQGQLITPLTGYSNHGGTFAIDNGCFTQFHEEKFKAILRRDRGLVENCKFVVCPDVVCSARRTLELFEYRRKWISGSWPIALVAQNGLQDLTVPWDQLDALFIGGDDKFKDGQHVVHLIKTAKTLGKWVHVGRVNGRERFDHFSKLGVDSCDGSGVSMYDHMLEKIAAPEKQTELNIEEMTA